MAHDRRGHLSRPLRLFLCLVACWIPAFVGGEALRSGSDLFAIAMEGNPYFVPQAGLLLYVWVPLVFASSCLLLLSPGLLITLALARRLDVDRWVVYGFCASLILVSAAAAAVQAILGRPLVGTPFAALVAGLAVLAYVILEMRHRAKRADPSPLPDLSRGVLATYLGPPLLLLVLLLPKFLWEGFNGDAAHAFEATRLLLFQPVPFWDPTFGPLAGFPGLTSAMFAYPASWFMRLFGELDVAARLPFIFATTVLYGGLIGVIRHRRPIPGLPIRWLVWAALSVFVLVMAYSATYNPYHADIALPGAHDALFLACFLGFLLAFLRGEYLWMAICLGLTVLSQPSWLGLVGLWLAAATLVLRPLPTRSLLVAAGLAVLAIGALWVLPAAMQRLGLPPPGAEYEAESLLERFRYLRLTHWRRFAFLAVPCGILPAIVLFMWRRQDDVARALTLVTGGYFLLFYVQAYVSLHHFAPAMVLPIAVLWRTDLSRLGRKRVYVTAGVLWVVSLAVAMPRSLAPHVHARTVGSSVLDRRPGYETMESSYYRPLAVYWELFPRPRDPLVPEQRYGGAPLAWSRYARRGGDAAADAANYVLQPAGRPAPQGMRHVATSEGADLYLKSDSVWRAQLLFRGRSAVAPLFFLPKGFLFRGLAGEERDRGVIVIGDPG